MFLFFFLQPVVPGGTCCPLWAGLPSLKILRMSAAGLLRSQGCWASGSAPMPLGTWLPCSSTGHGRDQIQQTKGQEAYSEITQFGMCLKSQTQPKKSCPLYLWMKFPKLLVESHILKHFFAPKCISSSDSIFILQGLLYRKSPYSISCFSNSTSKGIAESLM